MARILFYALVLVAGVSASKKITSSPVFSWDTDPVCADGESPFDCHLKKTQCGAISKVLEPKGAYIKNFVTCAKNVAAELGPFFFKNVGVDYSGDMATDKLTLPTMKDVRHCALNSTGLLMPDLTLNRTAIIAGVNAAFKNSSLGAVVAKAASTCPEPINYLMVDYMNCLKATCLENAVALSASTTSPTPVTTEAPLATGDRHDTGDRRDTGDRHETDDRRGSEDQHATDAPPTTVAPHPRKVPLRVLADF